MVDADAVLDQRLDDLQVTLGSRPLKRRVPRLKMQMMQNSNIVFDTQ